MQLVSNFGFTACKGFGHESHERANYIMFVLNTINPYSVHYVQFVHIVRSFQILVKSFMFLFFLKCKHFDFRAQCMFCINLEVYVWIMCIVNILQTFQKLLAIYSFF